MKKMLTFATLASMMFVSCVNDESASLPEQKQLLSFSAPTMKTQTRAIVGEILGSQYPDETFTIFSRIYSGNFEGWIDTDGIQDYFDKEGEIATKGGDYWTTQGSNHYWPGGSYNLAFIAYSPSNAEEDAESVTIQNDGFKVVEFKTKDDVNEQYDLMYSTLMYGLNSAKHGESAVPVHFNHALSSINFSAKGSSDQSSTYTIKEVKITGDFYVEGDFTQNISVYPAPSYESILYPETKGEASWSFVAYERKNKTYSPDIPDEGISIRNDEPTRFTSGTTAWLPIPQLVPDNAQVIITFAVTNASGASVSHTVPISLTDFKIGSGEKAGQSITEWKMGERYTYRIQFGGTQPIFFNPSISPWQEIPTAIYTLSGF